MSSVPYRLLTLDVDGTLLDPHHRLRPATVEAVRACLQAGVIVTLATGRLPAATTALRAALGLQGPIITVNGAVVAEPEAERVLAAHMLDEEQVARIEEEVQALGVPYCLFSHDAIYALPGITGLDLLQEFDEPQPRIVPALRAAHVPFMAKLLTIDYDRSHDEAMRARLGPDIAVVRTHPAFLEYLSPQASKGRALMLLAEWLEIDMHAVAAIGDSYNDLSMFAVAGLSVAMGQAPAEVRAQAKQITADNDHDGCAQAIWRYVLGVEQ
jgi:Cof subfamily protein (haloacid dehalogenase superfamily)